MAERHIYIYVKGICHERGSIQNPEVVTKFVREGRGEVLFSCSGSMIFFWCGKHRVHPIYHMCTPSHVDAMMRHSTSSFLMNKSFVGRCFLVYI
jgi:hypothetical protein